MKKNFVLYMVISFFALTFLWTAAVMAQTEDKPVTLQSILKAAGVPLTDEQTKKVNDLDLTKGREAFQGFNDMFTEKQMEALKKALGTRPGRDNGPETPRYITQLVVFEKSNCPLTEKQLTAMVALPNERGSYQKVNDLLTDKQKEAWQKIMPRRQ
jgi:hypothetical protein